MGNQVNEFLLPMKGLIYPIAQKPGASENGSWAGVFFNQVLFMLCLKKKMRCWTNKKMDKPSSALLKWTHIKPNRLQEFSW